MVNSAVQTVQRRRKMNLPLIRKSQQLSKVSKLFADQTWAIMLKNRYGITGCCPAADKDERDQFLDMRDILEYYYPENPYMGTCYIPCEDCTTQLIEKINLL